MRRWSAGGKVARSLSWKRPTKHRPLVSRPRQGHQGSVLTVTGDFFTIPPSGLTTMKHFPSMYEDYHRNVYDCSTHVYTPSGKHVAHVEPEWNRPGAVHSVPDVKVSFLKRRPDWARMQLEQLSRIGVPVKFGAKVVDVQEYEDMVVVKTSDGQEYSGDICIAASGIGSTIAAFATEEDLNVQDSGFAVARVAFPRRDIKDGSPAAEIMRTIDTRPEFRTYLADGVSLILFLTPDWVAWAAIHVVSELSNTSRPC